MEKVTIGNCTLYRADCAEVLPHLPPAAALVTDPPYELAAKGGGLAGDRQHLKDIAALGIDKGFDDAMLDGFQNWVCFCSRKQLLKIIQRAEKRKWMLITWNKTTPAPLTNNNYLPDTEYIVHCYSEGRLFGGYQDKARFYVSPGMNANEKYGHPTAKPVALMIKLLRLCSQPGDLILDPFMGSGTTGVACVKQERHFIGIEVNQQHFESACKRIEAANSQPDMFVTPVLPQHQQAMEL